MLKTNAGWISATAALALTLAACSGGGAGGASFQISTCSLGCSGTGNSQITCGVVGIAENQEISLTFTSPVDPLSVSKESFAVVDAITGASAAGTRFVDPTNPNRLIFRPKLTIGASGSPIFGFQTGRAYQVRLNGTVQNDPPPYVQNLNGKPNALRVDCTVEANQGVVDIIPGKPSGSLFVTTVHPISGAAAEVEVALGQTPGATNVKTVSVLRLEFDELMDISSMFNPSTGVSPNVNVMLDVDGNVGTTADRVEIDGTFSFGLDQTAQTTTLLFTPTDGYPSLGADVNNPRLVVVVLGAGVSDIAGNGLENPGTYSFVPQQITYSAVTVPAGGEQFTDLANFDAAHSGSPWGTDLAGRLTPGEGGGTGRHGELHVAAGETLVLHSSPAKASARIEFTGNPLNGDQITFAGVDFTFRITPAGATESKIQYDATNANVEFTVSTLVDVLNAYALANPGSAIASATYTQNTQDELLIEAVAPGIPSPPYAIEVDPAGSNALFADLSSPTLSGGFVAHSFSEPDILTNFDFDPGTGTPGGTPPNLLVSDGVFEFSRVEIAPTGTLVLTGDNPVRLLVRGDFSLADLAVIDLSGEDRPPHFSDAPYGQPGGRPGPGAGAGGRGGDRSNQPAMADISGFGVTVASGVLNGSPGVGVGGVPGVGQGLGGLRYPSVFPSWPDTFGGWLHNDFCVSAQMANTGSGGAYALDGGAGDTKLVFATGKAQNGATISNKPPSGSTPGGSAAAVGLEPASANPTEERLLSPGLGYLRGGSGGGGGGTHTGETSTQGFGLDCFTSIFLYLMSDNSGAGGGGGGGALQIQAGGTLALTGQIAASGGIGGDFASSAEPKETLASPGGGGSGGAVLLQAGTLELAAQPSRILVDGGAGGTGGYIINPSEGGDGSPGLVRVEQRGAAPDATTVAASTFPTDILDPTSVDWLSTGEWLYNGAKADEFDSVTGSQSCWMQVPGTHFSLTFQADPAAPAAPAEMGWNMDVILDLGGGEITVPWRGSDGNGPFLGLYPEEHWGTLLNRELGVGETPAPLVVRFQGALDKGTLQSPCDVDVTDPQGDIVIGSVTPWVSQPRELNPFLPLPTIVRFVILFDRSHPDFDMVKGVTNLRIEAQPE